MFRAKTDQNDKTLTGIMLSPQICGHKFFEGLRGQELIFREQAPFAPFLNVGPGRSSHLPEGVRRRWLETHSVLSTFWKARHIGYSRNSYTTSLRDRRSDLKNISPFILFVRVLDVIKYGSPNEWLA